MKSPFVRQLRASQLYSSSGPSPCSHSRACRAPIANMMKSKAISCGCRRIRSFGSVCSRTVLGYKVSNSGCTSLRGATSKLGKSISGKAQNVASPLTAKRSIGSKNPLNALLLRVTVSPRGLLFLSERPVSHETERWYFLSPLLGGETECQILFVVRAVLRT